MKMKSIRVLIADDHKVIRKSLRNLLAAAEGIEVVGEACDGAETLRSVEETHPDVLVLDMEMPVMTGNQVLRHLKQQKSKVRVLVISAYDDRGFIDATLGGHASGYVTKDEVIDSLIPGIRSVAGGERNWVSSSVKTKIRCALSHGTAHAGEVLNSREIPT